MTIEIDPPLTRGERVAVALMVFAVVAAVVLAVCWAWVNA